MGIHEQQREAKKSGLNFNGSKTTCADDALVFPFSCHFFGVHSYQMYFIRRNSRLFHVSLTALEMNDALMPVSLPPSVLFLDSNPPIISNDASFK